MVLPPGFEPGYSARKAEMMGRTTPRERPAYRGEQGLTLSVKRLESRAQLRNLPPEVCVLDSELALVACLRRLQRVVVLRLEPRHLGGVRLLLLFQPRFQGSDTGAQLLQLVLHARR